MYRKAKTWERDRRNRMNAYFKTLADLLPPHQEGRTRNKVDILIHASKYIKDLHNRTEELFHDKANEAQSTFLFLFNKLFLQVNKLSFFIIRRRIGSVKTSCGSTIV